MDDTVSWLRENLVKMAKEEAHSDWSHRKWVPPFVRQAPTRKEKDAKLACKQFLEYKRQKSNSTALRLDPEWFQYPMDDMGRSGLASDCQPTPPWDTLDDVEFAEFPLVRDVVTHGFTSTVDIWSVRAANQLASRERSRSRGNKFVAAKQPVAPV